MSNTSEKSFSETYAILVKRELKDEFDGADTARKLLLLTCEESNKTLSNKSTSVLYERNIQSYNKVISNGKIYEEKLSVGNNPSKWRSNLRNNKALTQHIKANTIKSSSLEDEFNVVQKVLSTKSDYVPQFKSKANTKYINPKFITYSNTSTNSLESTGCNLPRRSNFAFGGMENTLRPNLNVQNTTYKSNIQLKQITPVNSVEKPVLVKDDDFVEKKKSFNKYQPYKKYNYNKDEEENDDKFKFKKTNAHFKTNCVEEDDEEEENWRNRHFKQRKSTGAYKKMREKYDKEEDEEPPKKVDISAFKTAREELDIQHMKKHGTTAPLSNALKRKRLGLGGSNSKFVSPMLKRNDSSGDDSSKSQECPEQVVDERLKNIDPKMVDLIKSEIMDFGPKIDWNDIAGLEFAKTAIQEAVVWPMLRPDIFTGLRRPPKGILLFGPPGTGKTLIGKCVASQSQSTFFSISASSLTSKWIGDGEKMVRALFAVARCHQPAVIFIDEIDSLLSQRSDSEHESSRRIKTEFLVQLDGATTDNEERLLLIGATNRPQELDEAARRRFVKRLYIPLPELEARLQLVQRLMASEKHSLAEINILEIAKLSDGYSGADMRNLCADACMGPIRSIDISQIQNIQAQEVRPVSMADFTKSLNRVRPSVSNKDLDQYISWDKTYGSGAF